MQELKGKVALVTGAGDEIGRAVALALAARGVRVVVTGPVERSVAETVGEVVFGGGKARHVAGDLRDPALGAAAAGRANEVFGGLDFVVAAPEGAADLAPADAEALFRCALDRMAGAGHFVVTTRGEADVEGSLGALRAALATELAAKNVTATVLRLAPETDADAVGARVASLCAAPFGAAGRIDAASMP